MRQQILMKKIEKITQDSSMYDIVKLRRQDFEISSFQLADMVLKIKGHVGDQIENMKII